MIHQIWQTSQDCARKCKGHWCVPCTLLCGALGHLLLCRPPLQTAKLPHWPGYIIHTLSCVWVSHLEYFACSFTSQPLMASAGENRTSDVQWVTQERQKFSVWFSDTLTLLCQLRQGWQRDRGLLVYVSESGATVINYCAGAESKERKTKFIRNKFATKRKMDRG